AFTVELEADAAVAKRCPRFALRPKTLAYFAGSFVLSAGVLGALSFIAPSELEYETQLAADQVLLMRQYLSARAEREIEPGDAHEGGTGVRAKGEQAPIGRHHAIQGHLQDE